MGEQMYRVQKMEIGKLLISVVYAKLQHCFLFSGVLNLDVCNPRACMH